MQGYRWNCSAYHSFCCPISHENCISVMLANSVNRSARRHGYSLQHGPPILQLFHHSAGCSFPLLGHWMTSWNPCAYQFHLCHWWTGDTRSQAERNSSSLHRWVHRKELTYQPSPCQAVIPHMLVNAELCPKCLALGMHTFVQSALFVLNVWLAVSAVVITPPGDCHWLTHGLNRRSEAGIPRPTIPPNMAFSLQYLECPWAWGEKNCWWLA